MFNIFRKKSVAEQIENALDRERVIHAQEKRKLVNLFNIEKEKEIDIIREKYNERLRKKDDKIKEANSTIRAQRDAFRKFKDYVIQNEMLATELAAESEVFLEHASRIAGVFQTLRYRAERGTKQIEQRESKIAILKKMEIIDDDVEETTVGLVHGHK